MHIVNACELVSARNAVVCITSHQSKIYLFLESGTSAVQAHTNEARGSWFGAVHRDDSRVSLVSASTTEHSSNIGTNRIKISKHLASLKMHSD